MRHEPRGLSPFGASLFGPAHMEGRPKAAFPAVACAEHIVRPLAGVLTGPSDDPAAKTEGSGRGPCSL